LLVTAIACLDLKVEVTCCDLHLSSPRDLEPSDLTQVLTRAMPYVVKGGF